MRKPQHAYWDSLFRDIFNNADRLLEIHLRVAFWGEGFDDETGSCDGGFRESVGE